MTSISVEFVEEAEPLFLAANFTLRDYDSPDLARTDLKVALILTQAVDEESEGVSVVTSGGVQMEEMDSMEQFTKEYELTNGTTYSQYEQVSCRSYCWL